MLTQELIRTQTFQVSLLKHVFNYKKWHYKRQRIIFQLIYKTDLIFLQVLANGLDTPDPSWPVVDCLEGWEFDTDNYHRSIIFLLSRSGIYKANLHQQLMKNLSKGYADTVHTRRCTVTSTRHWLFYEQCNMEELFFSLKGDLNSRVGSSSLVFISTFFFKIIYLF